MTNKELKKRIKKAKERLNSLPQWVKDNNRFVGGYSYRDLYMKENNNERN